MNATDKADERPFDEGHETFRNELASVHADGRRKWVYARQPHGRRYRTRTWVSWALLAFLVSAPFVRFRGEPLVLLDVIERRFVFFGLVFWPQDFFLFVLAALTGLVTLALVTAAFGRVWCGWLCPQTIFMEMVFRKIEYLVDGSAQEQVRRDAAPWGAAGLWRRVAKHAIFFALSFAIANLFLAYVIGSPALGAIIADGPAAHAAGFSAIVIFSLLFYGVFARFREQVCTLACPYGRVMSALTDRHTMTVTYDGVRGEPRGRLLRSARLDGASRARGSCIDCGQCVTVCPTGIDIRNGIQLECINCTACMDACDDVMRRIDEPPGLIRWTSDEAVRGRAPRWLTARIKAYGVVWTALVATVVTLFATRPDVDVLILRQSGALFVAATDGTGANFYDVQIINRSSRSHQLTYRVSTPAGAILTPLGPILEAPPHKIVESRLLVRAPVANLSGPSTPLRFEIFADGTPLAAIDSAFLGPAGAAGPAIDDSPERRTR